MSVKHKPDGKSSLHSRDEGGLQAAFFRHFHALSRPKLKFYSGNHQWIQFNGTFKPEACWGGWS